jgi:hypothetical protein
MHLPSYYCVLCDLDIEESVDHRFLECDFARTCWVSLAWLLSALLILFRGLKASELRLEQTSSWR